MTSDGQFHMLPMWGLLLVVIAAFAALVLFFLRRAPADNLLVSELAPNSRSFSTSTGGLGSDAGQAQATTHDTLFILPDISNYTRFMTGTHFAFGHAQHIIFTLINAMIATATRTIELSKLEGDAALFFVDAKALDRDQVGRTVMDIFAAFFSERQRLMDSNLCPCRACTHIKDLDLKIFVHRGEAARFRFRGSVDHFGTDVIVLHRIMKNTVQGHRYVMVTDAAKDHIALPADLETDRIAEHIDQVGDIAATVYRLDDNILDLLTTQVPQNRTSTLADMLSKLSANARSVLLALRPARKG